MPAAKQLLRDVVEYLPDNATVEDAMDRLSFLATVARGLDAANRGDVVRHEEAKRLVFGMRRGPEPGRTAYRPADATAAATADHRWAAVPVHGCSRTGEPFSVPAPVTVTHLLLIPRTSPLLVSVHR